MKWIFGPLLWFFVTVSCAHSHPSAVTGAREPSLPILQGATSADVTQITVLVKAPFDQVRYEVVSPKTGTQLPTDRIWLRRTWDPDKTFALDRLQITGLTPEIDYELTVKAPTGEALDRRTFRSLNLNKDHVRLGLASCLDDSREAAIEPMWESLLEKKPEMMILLGDNVYADLRLDHPPPANGKDLWRRYRETREKLPFFRHRTLIPTLAIWDDHDYGANDGDMTYAHKNEAKQVFEAFFPQEDIPDVVTSGPGLSRQFRGFGQVFVLLDDRSFRSPNRQVSPNQTHWGRAQERWLFDILAQPPQNPTWLINGNQFFGGYHSFESYEGSHPASFKDFLTQLTRVKRPLFFASGDRHLTELMMVKIPGSESFVYELTTSPLHGRIASIKWGVNGPENPHQLEASVGENNFAIVESQTRPEPWRLQVTVFGEKNKILYNRQLMTTKGLP